MTVDFMSKNTYTFDMTTTTIDLSSADDIITISDPDPIFDNIMWSASTVGVTGPSYTTATGASGSVFTTNGTGGYSWASSPAITPMTVNASGTIDLRGENADININGESLMETLKEIRDQLRIPDRLARNSELEAEYEELRALGEQYKELEAKYKSHKKVFDILKRED
jgi:hypothetical protein